MTATDAAFQIAADGEVTSAEAAVPIAAAIEVSEPAGVTTWRTRAHLFLVSESLTSPNSRPRDFHVGRGYRPGRLRLSSEAELAQCLTARRPR